MDDISTTLNRAERRAAASAAHGGTKKYGWRVVEWSNAVGCSRARTYQPKRSSLGRVGRRWAV